MFQKISILVPTRKRIPRLEKMLQSYHATTADVSEIVFRVDDDDPETFDFLAHYHSQHEVVIGPRYQGYRSTHQFLADALGQARGDIIMVGNDDMVFETPGWDKLILVEASRYPDGLFDIGIETLNASHFPFSIVSRRVVDILGFVYDPRIFWGDIYLRDIMFHFGRAMYLPQVRITHDWAGYRPDATFMEAEHEKQTIGTAAYWEGHRAVVQQAIDRLSAAVGAGV